MIMLCTMYNVLFVPFVPFMEREYSKEKHELLQSLELAPPPHQTWSDAILNTCTATILYTENAKKIFPEMKLRGLVPNSYICLSVSHLNIPKIALPILRQIVGTYKSLPDT
jgi:hypothetical protein